ncbi:hypothetical protein ACSMXN_02160 [Jatrophihabitans sp. DSM 45814]
MSETPTRLQSQPPGRPSGRRRFRSAVTTAAVGVAAVVLLAGCATGEDAQTVEQRPAVDGVAADAGPMGIRDAGVSAPTTGTSFAAGGDAPLQLYLVNNGTAADHLTSVTTSAAKSVLLSLTGIPSPAASVLPIASSTPAPSDSSSATAAGSAAASDSASATPSATAPTSTSILIPAYSTVAVGYADGGPTILLQGLTAQLFTSQSIPITFTYASGITLSTTIAVKLTGSPVNAPTVDITPPGEG